MYVGRAWGLISASVALLSVPALAQEASYTQRENVVYGEVHGVGQLACLVAVTAEDEKMDGGKKVTGTRVKAAAVFFPPTDFLNYGDKIVNPRGDDRLGQLVRRLSLPAGLSNESAEELTQKITQI